MSSPPCPFVNGFSRLECARSGEHAGKCSFTRGSLAFSYTEDFAVQEMTRAIVDDGTPLPHRALDGGGERVYVLTRSDSYRFIDNNHWSTEERTAVAAQINAFIRDPTEDHLSVVFDRRAALIGEGVAAGIAAGALTAFLRGKRRAGAVGATTA